MAKGAPNPFRFNRPTPPQAFLGRSAVVDHLAEELSSWNGDSYAVIGGRRFGKSSLLAALEHTLLSRAEAGEAGQLRVLPVRISIQDLPPLRSSDDFFRFAIERAILTAEERLPQASSATLSPRSSRGDGAPPSRATLQDFEDVVLKIARSSATPLRVALLIDEIDSALDCQEVGALFGNLRSLVSTGRASDHARLVAAGVGRFRELDGKDSPLFNVLTPLFLEAFDEPSSRALIARAGSLDANVTEALLRAAGGHPFLLQYLLHYLFLAGAPSVTLPVLEDTVQKCMQDRRPDLEGWWHAVGSEAQAAYAFLAKTSRWTSVGEIVRALDSAGARVKRGLEALWFHGLVLQRNEHREYSVGGELFRAFYAEQRAPARRRMEGGLLPDASVREIFEVAIALGLSTSRGALLSGMPKGLVASLPHESSPSSQLLRDLLELNGMRPAAEQAPPLASWLENALALSQSNEKAQLFRRALNELRAP